MAQFEKDFRRLCRQIDSLSAGQARVSRYNIFDNFKTHHTSIEEISSPLADHFEFYIEISPHDGPYAQASYIFRLEWTTDNPYPECQPMLSCITPIYHPNIDTTNNSFRNNVCLSTLSDWDGGPTSTLEDLVQGLMFLFHSPNCDDPLTSNVTSDPEDFARHVRISIEGGEIEDFDGSPFEMNYGYKQYLMDQQKKTDDEMEQQQKNADGDDDENEQLEEHLVQILTQEPNYQKIFSADTMELLMDLTISSPIQPVRHNKETGTVTEQRT